MRRRRSLLVSTVVGTWILLSGATAQGFGAWYVCEVNGCRVATPSENLVWGGGPVLHTTTSYAVFWAPGSGSEHFMPNGDDAWYEAAVTAYFSGIGGSATYGVLSQYYDGRGHIQNVSRFGGAYWLRTPFPHAGTVTQPLTDEDIQMAARTAVATAHWPVEEGVFVFVFTPLGVSSCMAFPRYCSFNYFCGYHDAFDDQGQQVVYADIPDPGSGNCLDSGPSGNQLLGSLTVILSHEHAEGTTDPFGSGWMDYEGEEVGDKCAWDSGLVQLKAGGPLITVQKEWSNQAHGCIV